MKKLLLALLAILPFLDGGTNTLAQLLIYLSPLPILFFALKRKPAQKNFRLGLLPFLFFIFLVLLALSVPGSISLAVSVPAFFKMASIFLLFLASLLLFNTKEDLARLVKTILVVAFILSLISLHFLLPWVEKPTSGMTLIYATWGHNHLADYLVFALPLSLALFLGAKKGKQTKLYGSLALFFFLMILTTFSRASLLFLPAIALAVLVWSKPTRNLKKAVAWTLISVPIGLLLLITAYSVSPPGLQARLEEPKAWLVRQLVKPPFQEKRFAYWQEAATTMARYPLTGSGLGTFKLDALRFQPQPNSWSSFAHNFFFHIGAEAGILAAVTLAAFVLLGLSRGYQAVISQKKDPLVVGAFLGASFSLAQALLDWNWHFPAIFLTFLVLLAILVNLAKREPPQPPKPLKRLFWPLALILSLATFAFGLSLATSRYYLAKKNYPVAVKLYPWDLVNYRFFLNSQVLVSPSSFASEAARFIRLNGQDGSAHRFLGEKYKDLGQPEQALGEFELAALYNPLEDPGLYFAISDLYLELGEAERSKQALFAFDRRLGRLKEKTAENLEKEVSYEFRKAASEVYYRLAQKYFAEADYDQTFSLLAAAVRFDSWVLNHFPPLPVLAADEEVLQEFALTLEEAGEQFMLNSKRYYAKVFYLAGLEFWEREEFEQAASFWQKTVKLAPEWSQFWRELGGLYLSQGRFFEAGEIFTQCLDAVPGDPACTSGVKHAGWQKNWPESPGHLKGEILTIPD